MNQQREPPADTTLEIMIQIKCSGWAHPGSLDPILGREADKPAGVRCAALMSSLLFSSGVALTLGGTGETREGMSEALVQLTMWQAGVSSSERHLVCPRIRSFNPKSNHP